MGGRPSRAVYTAPCPKCGAVKWESCVSANGLRTLSTPHPERVKLYKDSQE